jgi:hypothetical protein
MPEYPENPNGIMEDETRSAFVELPDGHRQLVQFGSTFDCIMLYHNCHNPETIMETAKERNAIYEGKYIVRMYDGDPYLYTEGELRKLIHP